MFCRLLFVLFLLTIVLSHSSIYGFWLPLWYPQTLLICKTYKGIHEKSKWPHLSSITYTYLNAGYWWWFTGLSYCERSVVADNMSYFAVTVIFVTLFDPSLPNLNSLGKKMKANTIVLWHPGLWNSLRVVMFCLAVVVHLYLHLV
jgi:hypothetical protein